MKNEKIKNRSANIGVKLIAGGIFLIFGLATLREYVGIAFLIVSIVAFTYESGIEIDPGNNKVRLYTRYLWIVKGSWIELDNSKRLIIRRIRKGIKQYGGRTNASTSRYYTYFDVFLLADNYKKGLMLYTSKDKAKSTKFAGEWSGKLNIPIRS